MISTGNKKDKKVIASLDLGSDKIVCLIGHINSIDRIVIKGIGHQKSQGIMNGTITDFKKAAQSIISAVSAAEKMAGYNIDKIVVNISGRQIFSNNISAEIDIAGKEIKEKEIFNLAKNVQSTFKSKNKEVIHLIPLEYSIDGVNGIHNPHSMIGDKLSVNFHVVTTLQSNIKNIENCIKKIPLTINNFVSSSYTSALTCLTKNENELGSILIDIGGSNTAFSIFHANKFIYANNVPIGGIHITKDIASIIGTDFHTAEAIKTMNTDFTLTSQEEIDLISMNTDEENTLGIVKIRKLDLNDITKSRLREMLQMISTLIEKKNFEKIINNVVITGGTGLIPGIDTFAEEIFKKPVRVGYPEHISSVNIELSKRLQNPIYSSSIGILYFLKKMSEKTKLDDFKSHKKGWFNKLFGSIFRFIIND